MELKLINYHVIKVNNYRKGTVFTENSSFCPERWKQEVVNSSLKPVLVLHYLNNSSTSIEDPQGVDFISIRARFFLTNRMRSFFQCTNWTDGKQRLANGALIWRISAHILCEFHWCCSKQNVDGIEWANFGWKLLCVSQFFAWRKKFGEIDPRCFFKCINIVITLSDFRCFLNVSI